ncbi:MAG: DNA-directed RNA polymerase subunit L [Archaeoglobi archaeon]|jgi:DNA-directed RNA polymerase subunit L|nr:MAG: DNA-directed RNA polymerase subunit L [Archaeoglobi archaeon]TDA28880.1 MAG: DNA-directed RNA polymerase subunit L [Archaeoglobi archaeon]
MIKIVEIGKDYVKLIVKGEDHTYLNLLQHYLSKDDRTVLVRYNIPHPLVGEPELYLRVKDSNPLDVLKKANETIAKVCEDLYKQIS